jgi:predicted nucleic acid-binding protein
MTYLVDTNVLSEPTRSIPNPKVLAWIDANLHEMAVDPVILGEIRAGILLLEPGRKRQTFEAWFDQLIKTIVCIPWELPSGIAWAKLVTDLRRKGAAMPIVDSMIAATAIVHGLTVVTRNVRDFEAAGVKVINPFV